MIDPLEMWAILHPDFAEPEKRPMYVSYTEEEAWKGLCKSAVCHEPKDVFDWACKGFKDKGYRAVRVRVQVVDDSHETLADLMAGESDPSPSPVIAQEDCPYCDGTGGEDWGHGMDGIPDGIVCARCKGTGVRVQVVGGEG